MNKVDEILTPKVCFTSTAWLLHQGKVMMIKHKKLGMWLAPGGHIEENELPHQAAEREFWEETGIKVKAFGTNVDFVGKESVFVPNPFLSNLHWVCEENFAVRQGKLAADQVPEGWRNKGCEQHIAFSYFVKPVGSVTFKQNVEETLGIGWFTRQEVEELDTHEDVKKEAGLVFEKFPS